MSSVFCSHISNKQSGGGIFVSPEVPSISLLRHTLVPRIVKLLLPYTKHPELHIVILPSSNQGWNRQVDWPALYPAAVSRQL